MAPGKSLRASFCMPTEGTTKGSASASPRNTWEVQYCLYSPSDMASSLSKTRRSGHPGPRVTSLTGWPPGHTRFAPAKVLRNSPRLILVVWVAGADYDGHVVGLRCTWRGEGENSQSQEKQSCY